MSLVELNIDSSVATVTLNRPDKHNALNKEMLELLVEHFEKLRVDSSVRVILLKSNGKSFCAGADIAWQSAMLDKSLEENEKDIAKFGNLCNVIFNSPKPVIASVKGACFGGGVGIASSCDVVLATEQSTFSLSEVRLGLVPGVISPYVMRKINPSSVYRYFLTAERFDSKIAKDIGLVSEVLNDEKLLDEKNESLVSEILKNSPDAVKYCKDMINKVYDSTLDEAFNMCPRFTAERRLSAEGKEGMKAFLEKRKPSWSN